MMTLTSSAIDAMAIGARLKDDRVQGLEVRRHPTGTSFLLYYRTRFGVPRRPKIGAYPLLSIAQARDIARGMLVQVAAGDDPMAQRHVAKGEPDMDALWARCEAEHWNRGKKWDANAKSIYMRHIKPKLGKTKVAALSYSDVKEIHAKLGKTLNEANRMLAVMAKMMNLAERWEWRPLGTNPCRHVERFPEPKRRRFAAPEEIAAIGKAMDKLAQDPDNATGIAFLSLLLLSGARPSEIGNGKPEQLEVRDGKGVLRIPEGKTGHRDLYLPPQALLAVARLPKDRKSLTGRRTVPRALWKAVLKEAGIKSLWARDLRRTFATVALSGGVPIGVVGELLGHKSAQTTKIYAKLMEDGAHGAAASIANQIETLLGSAAR